MPSIKEKLEKRKDLLVRYLEFDGAIEEACYCTIFSDEEMQSICLSSDRNKVLLQTLIAKAEREGEGVLDVFVKVLKEIPDCEHLVSFCCDDELDEELTTKLRTQERWEEEIQPHHSELIKLIVSQAEGACTGLSSFFDELEERGILKTSSYPDYWRARMRESSVLDQAVGLLDKARRRLKTKDIVCFLLAEKNPKLLLEIENRAASAPAELSLPLAKLPPELLRENILKNFACLVEFLNFFDPTLKCECFSKGLLSETEFSAIEASELNRSRACLQLILTKAGQRPEILGRFVGVLKATGRERLAALIEGDPDGKSAERLWMERRYKQSINQHYRHRSDLAKLLAYELQAGRLSLDSLKEKGIITIDGSENAEPRKKCRFDQANWAIDTARELFKTPELIDYLLSVVQNPEDKKFLSALQDSALQPSSVVVSDEDKAEDARLLRSVLKEIKEAIGNYEKTIQEGGACLKAAEEKMTRAETEGKEALDAATQERDTVAKEFREKVDSADKRLRKSGGIVAGIDIEVCCDHCLGFPNFPECFEEVWRVEAAKHLKLVMAVDVDSDEQINALCDGLRNSRQMDVLRMRAATRSPEQEEAYQADLKKLENIWNDLICSITLDIEFLDMLESKRIISGSDCTKLKKFTTSLKQSDGVRKLLCAIRKGMGNSGGSFLGGLKFCLEAACHWRAGKYLEDGYKDDVAKRFNENCKTNMESLKGVLRCEPLNFARWSEILEKSVHAGIFTEQQADRLKEGSLLQTDRLRILKGLIFPRLDPYRIYKILRIIRKDNPKLVERLTTDEIREYQFNQYLVELAFTMVAINPKLAMDDLGLIITKLVIRAFGRRPSAEERDQHRTTCLKAKEELSAFLKAKGKLSGFLESRAEVPKPDDSELCDQSQSTGNEPMLIDCLKAKRKLSVFLENRAEVPKPDDSELCDQSQSTDNEPMSIEEEFSEAVEATGPCLSSR